MVDDNTLTGGTQPGDTARDPDLPRVDDPNRAAQEQDDSTKATAGVQLPGGTKAEVSTDGDQHSFTLTVPFGGPDPKPADTTPSPFNPDAPAPAGECMGADGRPYPNGWVIYQDNVEVERCVNGVWVPAVPPAPAPDPGDFPTQPDPTYAVASNDAYTSTPADPSGDTWSDPGDAQS